MINGSSEPRFSRTIAALAEITPASSPRWARAEPVPTIGSTMAGPIRIDAISPAVGSPSLAWKCRAATTPADAPIAAIASASSN